MEVSSVMGVPLNYPCFLVGFSPLGSLPPWPACWICGGSCEAGTPIAGSMDNSTTEMDELGNR